MSYKSESLKTQRLHTIMEYWREGPQFICNRSRTVDSIDYKKAMLLFYEQNNVSAFKRIFVEQFEFAVETYF